MFVFVLNYHGDPLMPCKPQKARKLLSEGKAKVIKRTPFTIRLLNGSSGFKQDVSLGVDCGTKNIGFSATTNQKVLFEGHFILRSDIQELLSARRILRSSRRSRKTRYRPARYLNRRKKKGWLPPSIQNKVNMHLKIVKMIEGILPIRDLTIEAAQFDIQKIKNPDIAGDMYQKGDQLGFWNVREYVLYRDNHTCQYCKGNSKDKILNVHHIESRQTGGDNPDNLLALCKTCHSKIHQEKIEYLFSRKSNSFRDATQMNIIRGYILKGFEKSYPKVKVTYGFITKKKRIDFKLKKTHSVDARCISGNPESKRPELFYVIKQIRSNNRQLHKLKVNKGGIRKSNKSEKKIFGFQIFDKVIFAEKTCFVFGRRKTGYFNIRTIDGYTLGQSISHKKLTLIEKAKTIIIDTKKEVEIG